MSGGIAAYKSAILVRRLREAGTAVDVLLTRSAHRFVGRTTFEGLSGRTVHEDLWERPMAHLDLGRAADAVVVAPATADLLSRLARGAADDLAAATLLAAPCPVLLCPAMNVRMWEHPATRDNVERLDRFGLHRVGPRSGPLAEEEEGLGRMAEPEEILAELGRILEPPSQFRGRKVVVTAGPTRAPVDPVRYVGNRSSGRMGFALAASAWRRGGDVVLVTGPGRAPRPYGPRTVEVETAEEMLEALRRELEDAGVLVMAAAVADFAAEEIRSSKVKRAEGALELRLVPGPDLLKETEAFRQERGVLTLGFALETEDAMERGRRKLQDKGVDFLAVNEVSARSGFDVATNRVTLLDRWGDVEELPLLSKEEVAERLLDRLEERLAD